MEVGRWQHSRGGRSLMCRCASCICFPCVITFCAIFLNLALLWNRLQKARNSVTLDVSPSVRSLDVTACVAQVQSGIECLVPQPLSSMAITSSCECHIIGQYKCIASGDRRHFWKCKRTSRDRMPSWNAVGFNCRATCLPLAFSCLQSAESFDGYAVDITLTACSPIVNFSVSWAA